MGCAAGKQMKGTVPIVVQTVPQNGMQEPEIAIHDFGRGNQARTSNRTASLFKPNSKPTWRRKLPVIGQGLVSLNIVRNTQFCLVIRRDKSRNWISLDITQNGAFFTIHEGTTSRILALNKRAEAALVKDTFVSYWFSYDRNNLVLKYGKGHIMEEAVLLKYSFIEGKSTNEQKKIRQRFYEYFNPETEAYIELYDEDDPEILHMKYQNYINSPYYKGSTSDAVYDLDTETLLDVENRVELHKIPLNYNIPTIVLDSTKNNLLALDKGHSIFSASLPPAAKELYDNVHMFKLNFLERLDNIMLSDAIRYSIQTRGCLLNNKLKEKSSAFGQKADPRKSYLRITLGKSYNTSPGIPYVLEIWPAKHYSPVHNHGDASAVIKVLFGSIHARIFNKLTKTLSGKDNKPQLLKEFDAKEGDITWMDKNWYQTHQLINMTSDFCATIQCYKYDESDCSHWPYFNYVSDSQNIGEFLPNTDFTFQQMYETTIKEYKASLRQ